MSQTLMLVGAHHDDNELMAGTIARHRDAGWRVVSVVMTNGRWTADGLSEDNIERRNDESRAAAKLLGTEPVFLGFREGVFAHTDASSRAVVEAIRKFKPDVVITHPPRDYHGDHMAVSRSVEDAVHRAGCPASDADDARHGGMLLYYCDAWTMPFDPDVYVDVSEHADLKRAALACHKSQFTGGVPTPGDMIDIEMNRSRQRGFESDCDYAEVFQFAPRPGAVRKVGLLG